MIVIKTKAEKPFDEKFAATEILEFLQACGVDLGDIDKMTSMAVGVELIISKYTRPLVKAYHTARQRECHYQEIVKSMLDDKQKSEGLVLKMINSLSSTMAATRRVIDEKLKVDGEG